MKQSRECRHIDAELKSRVIEEAMVAHYKAAHITLHVRKSNRAAISLYRDTLGFEVHAMEKAYCERKDSLRCYCRS
jgi:ribosomal protein S18 acetylase RimI-like enzyme